MDSLTEKTGMFQRLRDRFRFRRIESKPENLNFQTTKAFIDAGLKKISEGKFDEASQHFNNSRFAENVGLKYKAGESKLVQIAREVKASEVRSYQDELAKHSKANFTTGELRPAVFFLWPMLMARKRNFTCLLNCNMSKR